MYLARVDLSTIQTSHSTLEPTTELEANMMSVYAMMTLLAINSVAGQPSSYTQPTDRTDAPGLAPGVYAASGYLAQGPQPITEPFVELYNGSYGYRAYPGGFQEVT